MTPARRRIPKAAIPALLLLALTLGVQAQWVEDSIVVSHWIGTLAYNSSEDVVYGAAHGGREFFAIACSSNEVAARFGLTYPWYLEYDAIDNKAYCTFRHGDAESLLVVDGSSHSRAGAIALEWAAMPLWDPATNRLFISCTEASHVSVVDCFADTVIKYIQTPDEPLRIHLNERYRKLYVQCHGSQSLCIVDLRTLEVIKNIKLPGSPEAGCYSEAVDKYYCGAGQEVVVVDGTADTVVKRIPVVGFPRSMVSVPTRALVFVGTSYGGADTVYVVDSNGDSVVARHGGQYEPRAMVWSEATDVVYCANGYADNVTVVSGDGARLLDTLSVGDAPFAFAYSPVQRRLYVGHLNCSWVFVIRDTASGIVESEHYACRPANPAATVVSASYEQKGGERARLVDIAGRPVAEIVPGVNDVRRLPPGVYAVVGRDGRHRGKVVKVR